MRWCPPDPQSWSLRVPDRMFCKKCKQWVVEIVDPDPIDMRVIYRCPLCQGELDPDDPPDYRY